MAKSNKTKKHVISTLLQEAKLTYTYTVQTFREIFDGISLDEYKKFVDSLTDDELISFMDDASSFSYVLPELPDPSAVVE